MVKTFLRRLTAILLGALVLLEELAWGLLDALRRVLDRIVPLAAFHHWLRQRSKWQALMLFAVLLGLAEIGQVAALALIGTGNFLAGLGVLVALKMLGGLMVVTLWRECRAQLLTFTIIAWAHRLIIEWRARVHGWLDRQPLWRAVRSSVDAARAWGKRWLDRFR
ncbi:hypothetical protein VZ95_11460 [Elstera litoralis]|uniref:Uncharacterized protein n=1 Tax=Elstera litoralis TaxID=552518 RepID=A0A0F3IRR0_9PROT|nr:hypothetical protein [Elstera litoralis]KJV09440.1 hypothetical protein VZ95_11460 [Elstera litoralis]